MNINNKQLIRKKIDSIIKKIINSCQEPSKKNKNEEKIILLDFYSLITNIIYDQDDTIYLLHIISIKINNSSSILEKEKLLSLLPEFYVPFINSDITVTEPYFSRILTTIQSNILSGISPIFIGEIFKQIIFYVFNEDEEITRVPVNKDLFEISQGFCLYNMKQNQYNYQLCGVICLNVLLNGLDYSFLNINNFIFYILEKINYFFNSKNFIPKEYLLKYLYDLIYKFKSYFKPYAHSTIYKIIEFIDNKKSIIRKNSLNILSLLTSFYPNEIKPIKSLIIQLLEILKKDEDENIRNKSDYIYNKLINEYTSLNKSYKDYKKLQNNINLEKDNEYNNKLLFSDNGNQNNDNRINNRRIVMRKPIYIPNLNMNKCQINESNEKISLNPRKDSCRSIGTKSYFPDNKSEMINENKRYYGQATNISFIKNNYIIENGIAFRDLLNMVKKNCDKKCKLDNNFSNLRDEIKKNNNGLRQIRKIKSEKYIKTI